MYHFIVNPGSRTGKGFKIWKSIEEELVKRKIEYKTYFTKHAGHAGEYAKEICELDDNNKRIVVMGGDGSVNEAINGLTDLNNITLGYIPTGSGNDLARGLKIPRKPLEALELVLSPKHFEYFDIGTLTYQQKNENGEFVDIFEPRRFSVSSGIGYDADVCYDVLSSKLKKVLNKIHLGKLIYFLIGIKQAIINKPARTVVTIDGKEKKEYSKMAFIANMIHVCEGGGLPMGPGANPHDGKLTCCIAFNLPAFKFLLTMPTIFFGKHVKSKGVDLVTCSEITIETDRPLVLHTDGEFARKHDRVTLSCKDKLRFMV